MSARESSVAALRARLFLHEFVSSFTNSLPSSKSSSSPSRADASGAATGEQTPVHARPESDSHRWKSRTKHLVTGGENVKVESSGVCTAGSKSMPRRTRRQDTRGRSEGNRPALRCERLLFRGEKSPALSAASLAEQRALGCGGQSEDGRPCACISRGWRGVPISAGQQGGSDLLVRRCSEANERERA